MVPHEFLGIGAGELMLLVVLGVIFFGPERLPELSRKAAKVVHVVRLFANQATQQLRNELGPEYKDLKLTDLNPKTLIQKTLLSDIEGDLDDIKKELNGVKNELTGSVADMEAANKDVKSLVNASLAAAPAAAATTPDETVAEAKPAEPAVPEIPWDTEAT